MTIDDEVCYRALIARDTRFDGLFFVGVKSTGIYCRRFARQRRRDAIAAGFSPAPPWPSGPAFGPVCAAARNSRRVMRRR